MLDHTLLVRYSPLFYMYTVTTYLKQTLLAICMLHHSPVDRIYASTLGYNHRHPLTLGPLASLLELLKITTKNKHILDIQVECKQKL
jgi:hypothetical protein